MGKCKPGLRYLYLFLGTAFLFFVWALIAFFLQRSGNMILPYPHEAVARVAILLFGEEAVKTWAGIGWTLLRLLIGFSLSFLLAALLGTLAGIFPRLEAFLKPWVAFSRTIPTAAVVILLVGLFFSPKSKAAITYIPCILVFLVAFPLLYEAHVRGIHELDPDLQKALALESRPYAPRAIAGVLLPACWPYVKLALAQSLGLSMKVTVMSEIVASSSSAKPSLGGLIVNAQIEGRIEDVIAYALIALLLMVAIDVPQMILKSKGSASKKAKENRQ